MRIIVLSLVTTYYIALVLCDPDRVRKSSEKIVKSCYNQIDDPYILFSSKTAYRVNQNRDISNLESPKTGCKPKQFWMISRHGTRNPGTKDMKKMKERLPNIVQDIKLNHKQGRGSMCKEDVAELEDWKFLANVKDDKYLVDEGFRELKGLGSRYQKRFPSLLTQPFANESYVFKFTDSERTDDSAKAFAKGMFGKKDVSNVYMTKSSSPDVLLRFYKTCQKWLDEVDSNPQATMEKKTYEATPEFISMMQSVSTRLGYENTLSLADIDMMYSMCSFDKAWRPKDLSPWCAVFSQQDLEILEYREDLEYYYEDGYGFTINYKQACPPLNDVLDNFRQTVREVPSRPKGFFYFTHSGTILKVLARLGLFKDELRPLHSNRLEVAQRKWRTSYIDAFATNIAFVLFQCVDGYFVTAYFQERPILLPGCSQELCHYNDFHRHYGDIIQSCNIDDICRV